MVMMVMMMVFLLLLLLVRLVVFDLVLLRGLLPVLRVLAVAVQRQLSFPLPSSGLLGLGLRVDRVRVLLDLPRVPRLDKVLGDVSELAPPRHLHPFEKPGVLVYVPLLRPIVRQGVALDLPRRPRLDEVRRYADPVVPA